MKKNERRMERLRSVASHMETRIHQRRANGEDEVRLGWALEDLSALRWAIETLEPIASKTTHADGCALNDPETFANPATAGLGCTCGAEARS